MPRKIMTNLYYTSRRACREDCDTLGIDRRRVQTVRDGFETHVLGEGRTMQVVAYLRVDSALIDKVGVDALQNDDSEDYG